MMEQDLGRKLMEVAIEYRKRSYAPYSHFQVGAALLTKDVEIVKAYYKEPRCTFCFTVNGYRGLFEAVNFSCNPKNAMKISKKLPLLIVSGKDDPVGGMGKGVKKAYEMYQHIGMQDVIYKLYKDDRHEILNETDRQRVYKDLLAWMNARIK